MPEALEKVFGAIAGNTNAVNFLEATRAPTVNDDISAGFSSSSVWFNRSTGEWWTCSDASAGAAEWVELTSGGAEFPTDGLVALFHNPDETYDAGEVEWSASNNAAYKYEDTGLGASYQPTGVTGNSLITASQYILQPNAALAAAIAALTSLTLVTIAYGASNATKNSLEASGGNSYAKLTKTLSSAKLAGTAVTSFSGDPALTASKQLSAMSLASGGKATLRINDDAARESTGNLGSGAFGTLVLGYNDSALEVLGAGGCALIAIYSKALSDEEWAAIRSVCSDNALYGSAGVNY